MIESLRWSVIIPDNHPVISLLQMAPVIQKFLIEGSSLVSYAGRDKENLIQYLDENMLILKENLNDTNFEKILSVIWESSAQSLSDTIHLSIEVLIYSHMPKGLTLHQRARQGISKIKIDKEN